MKARGPVSRRMVRAAVGRLVSELDDRKIVGCEDQRHQLVESMLTSIDWGSAPREVIARVLDAVVSHAPIELLTRGARGEPDGLFGVVTSHVESNEEIRDELRVEGRASNA